MFSCVLRSEFRRTFWQLSQRCSCTCSLARLLASYLCIFRSRRREPLKAAGRSEARRRRRSARGRRPTAREFSFGCKSISGRTTGSRRCGNFRRPLECFARDFRVRRLLASVGGAQWPLCGRWPNVTSGRAEEKRREQVSRGFIAGLIWD